jgi:glycosyltransferase involved in cell wall biosynthesis
VPINLAFPLLGRSVWTGGYIYLKNTLRLINSHLSNEISASVFLSPEEAEKYGAELSALVDGRLIIDPAITVAGRGGSLVQALLTGRDKKLLQLLISHKIDVVFEHASFYGAQFGLPVVSWMPDFQHRHMPEMFGRGNWWRRDLGFRAQIRAGRTIMLSSQSARDDLERFYSAAKGRGNVVRFAIEMDIAGYVERAKIVRQTYGLPERFLFLPNQFWRHKNHKTVVAALDILKSQNTLKSVLPIVLSGQGKDPRNPKHFDQLMQQVSDLGVTSHFNYLGLIPYDDVLALNAACDVMINPSQFEGWSTPIEEAKAFATPLLLSNIPIHREQWPEARFFDPLDARALASHLVEISQSPAAPRKPVADCVAAQNKRLEDHAQALLNTLKSALKTEDL